MDKQFPEAHAIEFFSYKDENGFERHVTIRGDKFTPVHKAIDLAIEQILEEGGTPIVKGASPSRMSNKAPESSGATKMCDEHNVSMLERISKRTGKPYFSHSTKDGDNWKTCFGRGYTE